MQLNPARWSKFLAKCLHIQKMFVSLHKFFERHLRLLDGGNVRRTHLRVGGEQEKGS
jgi:hypothetical protein